MGYWREVHKRAKGEVLEMLKLEHPGRAALTVGLIAVPALLTWLGSHDAAVWVRTLATAGALAVCGAAGYIVKMLTIPPALALEAEAVRASLVQRLASFDQPDDDASMREGLTFMTEGDWGGSLFASSGGLPLVGEAMERVRKLAQRERIHVWGQTAAYTVHQVVPPYFWTDRGIDLLSVTAGGEPINTDKNPGLTPPRWNNLRVNRAEFEREWPSPLKLGRLCT